MSLVDSRMLALRSGSNLYKNEYRPSRYGALDVFMVQDKQAGGIITQEMRDKAKASNGRTLEYPVIDFDGSIQIGSARTVTIQDSENTSHMVSVTFVPYTFGFTQTPAMFMNNEIQLQEDFDVKMKKFIYKLAEVLDTTALSVLSAAKTAVFESLLTYQNVGNTVVCPWTNRDTFLSDLNVMMEANDYPGQLHVVGNPGLQSILTKLGEFGVYNAQNKQLEYLNKIMHYTNRATNASGKFATGYAIGEAQLGILNRVERESILGTRTADGHVWGIDTLPLLNLEVGTYSYEAVVDANAIAGAATADMTRARKQYFGFAVDLAFMTPYISDPSSMANPIIKFAIGAENAS